MSANLAVLLNMAYDLPYTGPGSHGYGRSLQLNSKQTVTSNEGGSSSIPLAVERYFLQVSTGFGEDQVSIKDCRVAGNTFAFMNITYDEYGATNPPPVVDEAAGILNLMWDYCPGSPEFDMQHYGSGDPSITNRDRLSFKKFRF